MELLFLRARYYDPTVGRFLAKDPWPGDISRPQTLNGWSYVDNNPINRIDPSGRFSNEAIATTFGVDNFNQVIVIFQQTGKWGFLRLLQDAREGDILGVGYEGKPVPTIVQPGRFICRNGKIETDYVHDFKQYLESLQYARFNVAAKWWRANTIDFYFLNGGGLDKGTPGAPTWWRGGYTDWKDWTNLPDFHVVSGGVEAPLGVTGTGSYIVDRYGRRYLSGAAGFNASFLPVDVSYAEGYISQWNYDMLAGGAPIVTKFRPATREEIEDFLTGFGETAWGTVGGGSTSSGGVAALFGEGLPGISWTASWTFFLDATENAELAWDWLDRIPGIQKSNILLDNNTTNCECQ
jgi:hypothetical protein